MISETLDPGYVLEQYEALRQEAVTTRPSKVCGQGLALLCSRGLPAWLAALNTLVPPPLPKPPVSTRSLVDRLPLIPRARAELTTVLAGMVLAYAQESEVS